MLQRNGDELRADRGLALARQRRCPTGLQTACRLNVAGAKWTWAEFTRSDLAQQQQQQHENDICRLAYVKV